MLTSLLDVAVVAVVVVVVVLVVVVAVCVVVVVVAVVVVDGVVVTIDICDDAASDVVVVDGTTVTAEIMGMKIISSISRPNQRACYVREGFIWKWQMILDNY